MIKKSSIDSNELNKFNRTCEQWWDKSGEFKILHEINPIRIKYINDKIAEHFHYKLDDNISTLLKNLDIMDVGCGGGLISIPISTLGAKVTAIDANAHNIEALSDYIKKNKLNKFSINPVNITVEEYIINYPGKLYDVIICLEVIEHVANQQEFLQNLLKLLKPGAILILSTINRTMKSYTQAIIAAEYILQWVPINTHDHSKFIKPSELNNIIKQADQRDFYLKNLTGLKFSPMRNRWYLSEDDIDVNYFASIAEAKLLYSKSS